MMKKNSLVTAAGVLAQLQTAAPPVAPPSGEPGSLYAAGFNHEGQLGVGDTVDKEQFTAVTGGITDWVNVQGGNQCYLAMRADRTIWSWGHNISGGTGLGLTSGYTFSPTQIGTDTDWDKIQIGENFGYAIKTDGTLWSWGRNNNGQLGQGDSGSGTERLVPTQVGTDTDWIDVQTGVFGRFVYATKTDGTLWACGTNGSGQLGVPSSGDISTFFSTNSDANWKQIRLGQFHVVGIKTDGTLWAVGNDSSAQLGQGTSTYETNTHIWTQVGTDADWDQVATGYRSNLALKTSGAIWGWGDNSFGSLGVNNTTSPITTPTAESSLATDWIAISSGTNHSFAKKSGGTLWSSGNNSKGQLALGNIGTGTDKSVFTQEVTLDTWEGFVTASSATMAIR